jgi:hypothetical protein
LTSQNAPPPPVLTSKSYDEFLNKFYRIATELINVVRETYEEGIKLMDEAVRTTKTKVLIST